MKYIFIADRKDGYKLMMTLRKLVHKDEGIVTKVTEKFQISKGEVKKYMK